MWRRTGSNGLVIVLALLAAPAAFAGNSAVTPVPRRTLKWLFQFAALNVEAHRGRIDLIYVGDSIVEHFHDRGRSVWEHYYAGRRAFNLGISGGRTENVLWRLQHGNIAGLSPRLAIVMIGQNNGGRNTGPEIAAGIAAIVRELRTRLPETKILLLAIFPRGEHPSPEREVFAVANRIASGLADGRTVFYRDIDGVFLRPDGTIPRSLMADYEHPTALGYLLWAEAIEPEVAELMGDRPVAPPRDGAAAGITKL